jgi:hypothetical protein
MYNVKVRGAPLKEAKRKTTEPDSKANHQNRQRAARLFDRYVRPNHAPNAKLPQEKIFIWHCKT